MSDILQITYYINIILVAFLIGFAGVLLSKKVQRNWIPKSFLLGTGILTLCAFWTSYFCESGLRNLSKFIIAIGLVFVIAICVRRKEVFLEYVTAISRNDILLLLVITVLGAIPMMLYIGYGAQFPYIDGYTYICSADYLMDHGYRVTVAPEEVMFHPWLSQIDMYQKNSFRIGMQMLYAFFSGLFNLEFSIEILLPITAYSVFLCGMGAWSFTNKEYTESKYYKIIAIVMVVVNASMIFGNAISGFLPQAYGSAYFMVAAASIVKFYEWKEDKAWSVVSTAIWFACVALTYNEMLPFLVLVAVIWILRYLIVNKSERMQTVVLMGSCAMVAMGVIVVYIPGMINAILSMFGATVGWHQDKDIFSYVAHFLSTVPVDYSFRTERYSVGLLGYEILTIVGIITVILGICWSSSKVKKEWLYVSLPYAMMFLYFIVCSDNPFIGGKGNSWSIYKLMQYYFIMLVPYLAVFISEAISKINKFIAYALICGFIVFNVNQMNIYMENLASHMVGYVGTQEEPIQEYYNLYTEYGNSEQRIVLHNVPEKHRQMITYFLKDVELVSDWNSDGYFSGISEMPQELYETGVHLVYNLTMDNIAGMAECNIAIELGEGFYDTETTDNMYWNWSKAESYLSINKYAAESGYAFYCEVFGTNMENGNLSIYNETGDLLQVVEVKPGERTVISLELDGDVNMLYFDYEGEIQIEENGGRELAFAISNYKIEEKK